MVGVLCFSLEMTFMQKLFLQMTGLLKVKFSKEKWILNCSYNPKHSSMGSHLDSFSKTLLSSKYNFILLGDFNSCMKDSPMKTFGEIYKLQNLIKEFYTTYSFSFLFFIKHY